MSFLTSIRNNNKVNALQERIARLYRGVDNLPEYIDIGWLQNKITEYFKAPKDQKNNGYLILIKSLEVIWTIVKLILFFLAPLFILFYGLEINSLASTWHSMIIGWSLIIIGSLGLISLLISVYLVMHPPAVSDDNKAEFFNKGKNGGILFIIDLIAIAVIFGFVSLKPNHQFQWWFLKIVEDQISYIYNYTSSEPIAKLTKVTNNADEIVEFNLRHDKRVHIIAAGELIPEGISNNSADKKWVDYGWIERLGVSEPFWTMKRAETKAIGGLKRNQRFDGCISLPAGQYKLRYKSDGSHSFRQWDDNQKPDEDFWGIVVADCLY